MKIESMAATRAMEFGLEVGIDWAIVEGDSEIVVKALLKGDVDLTAYGLLIKDAGSFAQFYLKLMYSHTKRDGNKVAHRLERLVVNIQNCAV